MPGPAKDLDPREHERHDQPRHELLGKRGGRDQRLIFAMNGMLQELDAKTGKPIMTFGTNGVPIYELVFTVAIRRRSATSNLILPAKRF